MFLHMCKNIVISQVESNQKSTNFAKQVICCIDIVFLKRDPVERPMTKTPSDTSSNFPGFSLPKPKPRSPSCKCSWDSENGCGRV